MKVCLWLVEKLYFANLIVGFGLLLLFPVVLLCFTSVVAVLILLDTAGFWALSVWVWLLVPMLSAVINRKDYTLFQLTLAVSVRALLTAVGIEVFAYLYC